MSTRIFATVCLLACASSALRAQAIHTASRIGDLQVGAGFVLAKPDYYPGTIKGGGLYVDFDRTNHWGGEFEIHQANAGGDTKIYERTYEVGARYHRTYGRALPYAKIMIGRGVFNFPGQYDPGSNTYGPSVANLAYNMYAVGFGSDFRVKSYLNVRAEYEYQSWYSFPPNGLTPQLFTLGVAYHFPGDLKGKRRR